jgi:hypothetical protein
VESPRFNQKEEVPFAHYLEIYRGLDPRSISGRCALPFDGEAFSLTLMGTGCRIPHPDFSLTQKLMENILILRYLCEGKFFPDNGKRLSYNEIPWGTVYYRNFEGRCLKRLAYTFGNDIKGFKAIIEGAPGLKAESLSQGDAGYRIQFLNGLWLSLILYGGDDEFPPSSQILFDDNFVFAFTAEDLAVAGEVVIDRLKELSRRGN